MAMRLSDGYLPWKDIEPHLKHLRELAIQQFINLWHKIKDRKGDASTWGDEVEYEMLAFHEATREVFLSIKQDEILQASSAAATDESPFQREYAAYMVESTPLSPYTVRCKDLARVEQSMKQRRKALKAKLEPNEAPFTISMFPRLGATGQFSTPRYPLTSLNQSSLFVPDELVSTHSRYQAVEINLRARRGGTAIINIPVFEDVKTQRPWKDPTLDPQSRNSKARDGNIHLDALIGGAGGCGVQVTFEAESLAAACALHDQLVPLGPLMMALTAATPAYKGFLADTDVRWDYFAASVDDRVASEHETLPQRWSLSPSYLCEYPADKDSGRSSRSANLVDDAVMARLQREGLDEPMAHYFAGVFARDPILVTREDLAAAPSDADAGAHAQAPSSTRLFDSMYATVWSHVRLKLPPPADARAGWRVEFRMMEVQPTDFENAAACVFVALLRAAVARAGLDLRVPMRLVEANARSAHARDAAVAQRFWFARGGAAPEMMTLDEIFNGGPRGDDGGGLVGVVERHLAETERCEAAGGGGGGGDAEDAAAAAAAKDMEKIRAYIDLIRRRARGSAPTPARWIRDFVRAHAEYGGDSEVGMGVCYDLLREVERRNR